MSLQFSTAVRNSLLDAIEVAGGASAIMGLWTGAVPANCAAANSGTRLATINLPADWMAAASGGTKAKLGTWEDTQADAAGTAGYFRIYASDGTTVVMQGTVTATGGGGDLTLDNAVLAVNQDVVITAFTLTAPGA